MKLELIEYIDEKLEELFEHLPSEEAYLVKNAVVSNLTDPELDRLVADMMAQFDVDDQNKKEALAIVRRIQQKGVESLDE